MNLDRFHQTHPALTNPLQLVTKRVCFVRNYLEKVLRAGKYIAHGSQRILKTTKERLQFIKKLDATEMKKRKGATLNSWKEKVLDA